MTMPVHPPNPFKIAVKAALKRHYTMRDYLIKERGHTEAEADAIIAEMPRQGA